MNDEAQPAPLPAPTELLRVSVVDINMPFASMVGFMLKWSLATIPALLILGTIAGIIALVIAGIGASMK